VVEGEALIAHAAKLKNYAAAKIPDDIWNNPNS
jgi:hypothetical protein